MRRVIILILAALATTAGSCSFSIGGLDYETLETAIQEDLAAAYGSTVSVSGVSCPEQEPTPTTGDTFICNAAVGDSTVRVEVQVTNDDLDVTFETLDLVYDVTTIEQDVSADASEQIGIPVQVDCGDPQVRVVPISGSFDCVGTDANGATATIRITADSLEDTSWEVVQ